MDLKFDLSKEYGIVLEGGGARGAYQIGTWKALKEAGVMIRGVAGASVGALNGALICMDNIEKAEEIWENITYSRVMDVNDDLMTNLMKWDIKSLRFQDVYEDFKRFIKDRGFDITPLRTLIGNAVSEDIIRKSEKELYVTTYSVSDRQVLNTDVKALPEGSIADMLLASAYFPVFKNEKLGGKRYLDGGGFDNVPTEILLEHGYKDIIIIRIYGLGFDSEKVTKIPEDVHVIHIAPRQDLGGILEFDKKRSRKNMVLGYYDAKRMLYGLKGKHYYIDAPYSEPYYFDKMMSNMELFRAYIHTEKGCEDDYYKLGYRAFTEQLFPAIAEEFKLKEDWDYKELYLAVLEDLAIKSRINRFQIYPEEELLKKIHVKLYAAEKAISQN